MVRGPGPLTMLVGYVLLGLQPLPVKALTPSGWSAPLVVSARFVFSLLGVLVICLARRRGLRTAQPGMLTVRGVLGGIAVLLYFTSVQLAGASIGTLLNYTYPLWANVFATLFTKHRPPRAFWLLLLCAFGGVWLIVSPSFSAGSELTEAQKLGQLCGILSAVAAGGGVLSIKQLRETDEELTIITSFSVVGLVLAAPLLLFPSWFGLPSSAPLFGPTEAALAASVGALAFGGHYYFTSGYRGTSVPLATAMSLSVPVVAALAGGLLLGERLGARFFAGGSLVLAACLCIGWLETRTS